MVWRRISPKYYKGRHSLILLLLRCNITDPHTSTADARMQQQTVVNTQLQLETTARKRIVFSDQNSSIHEKVQILMKSSKRKTFPSSSSELISIIELDAGSCNKSLNQRHVLLVPRVITCSITGLTELSEGDMTRISLQGITCPAPLTAEAGGGTVPGHADTVPEE